MKNKLILFGMLGIVLLILFSMCLVSAQNTTITRCYYDDKPHFNYVNTIIWNCEVSQPTKCLTYIFDEERNIIDVHPEIQIVKDVGVINTYNCDMVCPVEFGSNWLKDNYTYTFGIICENSTFERQITPQLYFGEQQNVGRVIWIKDNLHYIIGAFAILLIIVSFILWLVGYFGRFGR